MKRVNITDPWYDARRTRPGPGRPTGPGRPARSEAGGRFSGGSRADGAMQRLRGAATDAAGTPWRKDRRGTGEAIACSSLTVGSLVQ